MANFCTCSDTLLNTGVPNKQRVVKDGAILVAVPLKADDGTSNVILNADTISDAYISALINQDDPSKRWYPIGKFINREDVRADPTSESFNDGSSAVVQQGVRTYDGYLINYAPKYLANLSGFSCIKFGLFIIDDCGNLQGSISKDGAELRPIRVNEASWYADYVKGSSSASAKVRLRFEFSQLEADQNLRVINDDEMTADLTDISGLVELNGAVSGIIATGFVVALTVDYDYFMEDNKVLGWLLADFSLYNETTSASVTITSVTEAPDGTYTFVIPAQTAGDVLTLKNVKTIAQKAGYNLLEEIIAV